MGAAPACRPMPFVRKAICIQRLYLVWRLVDCLWGFAGAEGEVFPAVFGRRVFIGCPDMTKPPWRFAHEGFGCDWLRGPETTDTECIDSCTRRSKTLKSEVT
jgi:hypothetical protein